MFQHIYIYKVVQFMLLYVHNHGFVKYMDYLFKWQPGLISINNHTDLHFSLQSPVKSNPPMGSQKLLSLSDC